MYFQCERYNQQLPYFDCQQKKFQNSGKVMINNTINSYFYYNIIYYIAII